MHHEGSEVGHSSNKAVGFLYDKESNGGSAEARPGWNVSQWKTEDTRTHRPLNYEVVTGHHM